MHKSQNDASFAFCLPVIFPDTQPVSGTAQIVCTVEFADYNKMIVAGPDEHLLGGSSLCVTRGVPVSRVVSARGEARRRCFTEWQTGMDKRRLQTIQRPQCSPPPRMPSIPMCCVKVGPVERNQRGFFSRRPPQTHTHTYIYTQKALTPCLPETPCPSQPPHFVYFFCFYSTKAAINWLDLE